MNRHAPKTIYQVGNLRVWVMDHLPCFEPDYYPVVSSAHAATLIQALVDSQLLDPNITDNAFGLEKLDSDGEWIDWDDENGAGIMDEDCILSEHDGGR